jgi:hypothetical protein
MASAVSARVYTSVACAGPGQHKGDWQQHSLVHLLYFENFDTCAKKMSTHAECALKKGLCMLSVQ